MVAETDLMPVVDGFPRPDWNAIAEQIHNGPENTWEAEWQLWSHRWLDSVLEQLPDNYRVVESDNFLVLTAQEDRYVDLLSTFLERTLKSILSNLGGIASDDGLGKHVVLMFDNQEHYYQYNLYFYPDEGEFALSSGMFLNVGYGHFVFPYVEQFEAEATSAHELTHACLRHLPLPLWLNEGFAVTMEDDLCGSAPLRMDKERLDEHREFWNADTIQEFWSGTSFQRTDEGNELSYELARYCLRALAHEYDVFSAFANSATFEDGGESSAMEFFGGSLGGVIQQFFGDGSWHPQPDSWSTTDAA